ncbi:putative dimethylaniline monooxygenase [Corchorus capsularis]|uniref:Putative dimethylaniline monooxygenase n=1 Tax=Corchorus capsularis TaxID=210143 RepID=A0A1R3GMQ2_COCAP|nr:putative dimethylaniline monooxygenase [Corchorus capsularis]
MAFVGYIESVSNLHTTELRCKLLSKLAETCKLEEVLASLDSHLHLSSDEMWFAYLTFEELVDSDC